MYTRESSLKEEFKVRPSTIPKGIPISMLSWCNHINESSMRSDQRYLETLTQHNNRLNLDTTY